MIFFSHSSGIRILQLGRIFAICSWALMHLGGRGGGGGCHRSRSPFGHLMKFTHRNFPFYLLGLSTVSKLVRLFFCGWGWCYVYLDYYHSVQQILSGSSGSWVRILLSFITNLFFLSNWRDLHFHEYIRLEISPKCDIKAENSSTLCKFHEGRKGLPPMGSNADPCTLRRVAQLLRLHAAFIRCLHFIYAHKFCVHTFAKITPQWKSTLRELLHIFRVIYLLIIDTFAEIPAT